MSTILIIWQEIPESCGFIELNANEEGTNKLLSFHGHYINDGNEDKSEQISTFFYENGSNLKFSTSTDILTNVKYDYIIMTGFLY